MTHCSDVVTPCASDVRWAMSPDMLYFDAQVTYHGLSCVRRLGLLDAAGRPALALGQRLDAYWHVHHGGARGR